MNHPHAEFERALFDLIGKSQREMAAIGRATERLNAEINAIAEFHRLLDLTEAAKATLLNRIALSMRAPIPHAPPGAVHHLRQHIAQNPQHIRRAS